MMSMFAHMYSVALGGNRAQNAAPGLALVGHPCSSECFVIFQHAFITILLELKLIYICIYVYYNASVLIQRSLLEAIIV